MATNFNLQPAAQTSLCSSLTPSMALQTPLARDGSLAQVSVAPLLPSNPCLLPITEQEFVA